MNALQEIISIRERMKPGVDELQGKLGQLMQKYGVDKTCAATGWKASTIEQYLRNPRSQIRESVLERAILVLKEWERRNTK